MLEFYTATGCNTCPAANRWFSALASRYPPERLVPVALHVDYLDYTTDARARRDVLQRQRRMSMRQRLALVYTPQVLVQGSAYASGDGGEVDRVMAGINASRARAQIALQLIASHRGGLQVRAEAASDDEARLYMATYESRLEGPVILEWTGPFALGRHEVTLALLPKATPAGSGVVAFVQKQRTAEVLQALMLAACSP
ncbi:MAG TPA: DUF1223 domain-containing protein [Burkholderiales bacterium]|nr:DUF1223 domain-containing protein [Burkholderiales bacterium]